MSKEMPYPKPAKRPKKVIQTPTAVLLALDRRDGHICAWLGFDTGRLVPQHRQGGAGGRKNKHRLSNVIWLDSLINGEIESDPAMQAEATMRGIKISIHADPEFVPIHHAVHGLVRLTDQGTVNAVAHEFHAAVSD